MANDKTLCEILAEFDELMDTIDLSDLSSQAIVEKARQIETRLCAQN